MENNVNDNLSNGYTPMPKKVHLSLDKDGGTKERKIFGFFPLLLLASDFKTNELIVNSLNDLQNITGVYKNNITKKLNLLVKIGWIKYEITYGKIKIYGFKNEYNNVKN